MRGPVRGGERRALGLSLQREAGDEPSAMFFKRDANDGPANNGPSSRREANDGPLVRPSTVPAEMAYEANEGRSGRP